jgi:hypothetical protein
VIEHSSEADTGAGSPTLKIVNSPSDGTDGDAVDRAVANAALEGIEIPADEQELIRQRQRGEISHEDFLRLARSIAVEKSEGRDD